MSTSTLGIDEAGRGPLLGPMVLAAVCVTPRAAAALTRLGVRDSKAFGAGLEAHEARCKLAAAIRDRADSVHLRVVSVEEIDARVANGELNVLEREYAEQLIAASAPARRIVCDGARLFGPLRERFPTLTAHDHGESHHVSIAAASIIAKVRREEEWHAIAARYTPSFGPIAGGGYVNAATRRFVRAYIERHREPPPELRRSWPLHFAADLFQGDLPVSPGRAKPAEPPPTARDSRGSGC